MGWFHTAHAVMHHGNYGLFTHASLWLLRHNMKRIRFWVSLFCIIFGALESRLQLGVKRNMSNWQLYICIFIKRLDSTSADRFSGSISFFLFCYYECSAVYIWFGEEYGKKESTFKRVLQWMVKLFFFFCLCGKQKRWSLCPVIFPYSYWLSIICWKSAIRLLKSILFSGAASQHLLIRLYNCQNTKLRMRHAPRSRAHTCCLIIYTCTVIKETSAMHQAGKYLTAINLN